MKRLILIITLSILSLLALFAVEPSTNSLLVKAEIPEDFGIEFPENVIHMDRMYFSLTGEADSLLSSEYLDAGTIQLGMNEYRIMLLYYGNQSENYNFTLRADAGDGWVDAFGNIIPITVRLEDATVTDDITVAESDIGSVDVSIPAKGPRWGEHAVDIVLEWSGSPNPEPGTYTVELDLYMYAI